MLVLHLVGNIVERAQETAYMQCLHASDASYNATVAKRRRQQDAVKTIHDFLAKKIWASADNPPSVEWVEWDLKNKKELKAQLEAEGETAKKARLA